MAEWSERRLYQGKWVNEGTYAILMAANKLLARPEFGGETSPLTLVQGSYNTGVGASGGTHNGGGAIDITAYNWKNRVKVFRILGVAMWYRPTIKNLWSAHCHGIVCGDGTASTAAKGQVTEYYAGGDGLKGSLPDPNWRPKVLPILFRLPVGTDLQVRYAKVDSVLYDQPNAKGTKLGVVSKNARFTPVAMVKSGGVYWVINIEGKCAVDSALTKTVPSNPVPPTPTPEPPATPKIIGMRMGQLNLPGPDKHGDAPARAKRAAAVCKAQNLDVIGLNELVGPGKDSMSNAPSPFARMVLDAFGPEYSMSTPSTAYNENYSIFRKSTVGFIDRPADSKIYARLDGQAISGRHVTHTNFKWLASGTEFSFNETHLIENNEPGAQAQGPLVWSAVAKNKGNRPAFIFGDMNTDADIAAFVNAGLKNARKIAAKWTDREYATYVKWADTTPNIDSNWIIDQLWVPPTFNVNGYTVVVDDDETGHFNTPRFSDHLLVIASVTEK